MTRKHVRSLNVERLDGRALQSGLTNSVASETLILPYIEQQNLQRHEPPGRQPGEGHASGIIAILIGL